MFERLLARRTMKRELPLATALARRVVDYTITPRRLTPGFGKRLPASALVVVYAAFALGLALSHVESR